MKKSYGTPQLKVHGTIAQLTQDVTKGTGRGDFYAKDCLDPISCSKLC